MDTNSKSNAKKRKLKPLLSSDPSQIGFGRLLSREIEQLASSSGLGEAFIHGASGIVLEMLLNRPHDVIETVTTIAPSTGHLVVGFRINRTLHRALASAAQNSVIGCFHNDVVFH